MTRTCFCLLTSDLDFWERECTFLRWSDQRVSLFPCSLFVNWREFQSLAAVQPPPVEIPPWAKQSYLCLMVSDGLCWSDHYKLVSKSIETLQHPTWPDNRHQPLGFQSGVIRLRASQSSEEPTAQARPLSPESGRVDWWAGRPEENDFIIVMNKNLVKVGRLEGLLNYCLYKHIIYVAQFIRALTKWLLKYFQSNLKTEQKIMSFWIYFGNYMPN